MTCLPPQPTARRILLLTQQLRRPSQWQLHHLLWQPAASTPPLPPPLRPRPPLVWHSMTVSITHLVQPSTLLPVQSTLRPSPPPNMALLCLQRLRYRPRSGA